MTYHLNILRLPKGAYYESWIDASSKKEAAKLFMESELLEGIWDWKKLLPFIEKYNKNPLINYDVKKYSRLDKDGGLARWNQRFMDYFKVKPKY